MSNLKTNSMLARALIAASLITTCHALAADAVPSDPAAIAMRQALAQRYPNTKFGDVQRTPVAGVWEVWMGANVAYVSEEGRHFIFGHLYDMQTQTDLTAARKEQASEEEAASRPALRFADLPLHDAIKTVRGNGARQLAVFADPQCGHCRNLERELAKLDNVTVYTFLFPLAEHQSASANLATSIWCAKDKAQAWHQYMGAGVAPKPAHCDTPIGRNVTLATSAGIGGTPYLLFANGAKAMGALSAAALEQRLAGN